MTGPAKQKKTIDVNGKDHWEAVEPHCKEFATRLVKRPWLESTIESRVCKKHEREILKRFRKYGAISMEIQ